MDLLERLQTAFAERYRTERELGRGGMATVYLAEDLKHGRRVALKVLRPELSSSLGAEHFHREIEAPGRSPSSRARSRSARDRRDGAPDIPAHMERALSKTLAKALGGRS